MSGDTTSVLFGRTLNPINRAHTAGGSSGGDSALVAFRGSPMSIGTEYVLFSFLVCANADGVAVSAAASVFRLALLVCMLFDRLTVLSLCK